MHGVKQEKRHHHHLERKILEIFEKHEKIDITIEYINFIYKLGKPEEDKTKPVSVIYVSFRRKIGEDCYLRCDILI